MHILLHSILLILFFKDFSLQEKVVNLVQINIMLCVDLVEFCHVVSLTQLLYLLIWLNAEFK